MAYQVIITPAADKVVKRLPMRIRTRIADHMAALAENPRPPGSVKLTNLDAY